MPMNPEPTKGKRFSDTALVKATEEELLAIAHAKVKEAIIRTEQTIEKVDGCLEKLSASSGAKYSKYDV